MPRIANPGLALLLSLQSLAIPDRTVVWAIVIAAVGLVFWSLWRQRLLSPPSLETREVQLTRRVGELEATVKMLLSSNREYTTKIEALERKLALANERIHDLEMSLARYEAPKRAGCRELVVCVGDESRLRVDLARLRGVERKASIRITRLLPASFDGLKRLLSRRRENGTPITLLHMAVHAGPDGIHFADRVASGIELSEILKDVEVLLIAGCSADQVGDLLGVVANVITLREDVLMDDAAAMTEVFWEAIANGLSAQDAFDRVLVRCPAVAEFVELHQ